MLLKEPCKHLHLYLKVVVYFNEFFALASDLTDNHFERVCALRARASRLIFIDNLLERFVHSYY
jgi:hypothetical protein